MQGSIHAPMKGPPLALTQGDPAGIGPEITLRAWRAAAGLGSGLGPGLGPASGLPAFLALADPALLAATARRLGLDVPLAVVAGPEEAAAAFARALPVLPPAAVGHVAGDVAPAEVAPGVPDPATAPGTIASIARAVALVREGRAGAVVTNPIAKHVLTAAGFAHPGHTEYLAALARDLFGDPAPHPVMMLWCETLAVVPITIHIPLRAAPDALTTDLVVATARIVDADLRRRFGLPRPRLALAGLNPHAGEAGTMGLEERDVLAPAVARLRGEGIAIQGPFPADTLFHPRARETYDAALCPTHDQALIPIKTIAFDEGVNVTLGLPFVRTSPDHGTAFDIAGRGVARPDSLIAALRLAGRLAAAPA